MDLTQKLSFSLLCFLWSSGYFACVQLETIENFTAKIKAGQAAKISPDFMIAARMESLIAGHGQEEALKRAVACTEAGADAIMIHSKEKSPAEVGIVQ